MNDAVRHAAETTPETPGRALAAARAAHGFAVADVAMRLKFSLRQIEALESDDYGALPGGTFVRGMVRTYARFLDLDAEALVHDVSERLGLRPEPVAAVTDLKVPFQAGPKRSSRVYLLLSLAVLVAAGLVVGDWVLRTREEARLAATEPTPTPAPVAQPQTAPVEQVGDTPSAAPAAAEQAQLAAEQPKSVEAPASPPLAEGMKRLRFDFERESWVEVKDAQGKTLLSQLNPAGTQQVVTGTAPLQLVIGNASGVRVIVNDAPIDLKPFTRVDVARLTLD